MATLSTSLAGACVAILAETAIPREILKTHVVSVLVDMLR